MSGFSLNSAEAPEVAPTTDASAGAWRLRWRRLRRHRPAMASLVVLCLLVLFCLAAWPLAALLHIDPDATDLLSQYGPPDAQHWLGTDDAGRDELVRLMLGGQMSLLVGVVATALGTVLGLAVGLCAGYFGGRADGVLMRATDGVIALPLLPLLIVLGALDLTKLGLSPQLAQSGTVNFWRIVIIIALVNWTQVARLVRASTLSLRERDFVRAARANGAGALFVMRTHILPNVATPLIVATTLTIGQVILIESVLSFLGYGIQPPTPSWGNMLNNAQELVTTAPMLAIYPGLLIFLTVIAVNFLGDGLQNAFDPRSER